VLGEDLRPAPSVVAGGGFNGPFLWYMHHRVSVPIAALVVEHPANLSFIFLVRAFYLSCEPPKPMCYRYVRFGKLNLLAVRCYLVDLIDINSIVSSTARHNFVYLGRNVLINLNLSVLPRTRLLYLIYRKDNVSAGPPLYRVFSSAANQPVPTTAAAQSVVTALALNLVDHLGIVRTCNLVCCVGAFDSADGQVTNFLWGAHPRLAWQWIAGLWVVIRRLR
jgi:hypothetical protein